MSKKMPDEPETLEPPGPDRGRRRRKNGESVVRLPEDISAQYVDAGEAKHPLNTPAYVRREGGTATASLRNSTVASEPADFLLHLENRSLELQLEKQSIDFERLNLHHEKQHSREGVRTLLTIAILSAYLVFNIILIALVSLGKMEMSVAKDISATFLTPILGLSGSALGFYFGVSFYDDMRRSRRG